MGRRHSAEKIQPLSIPRNSNGLVTAPRETAAEFLANHPLNITEVPQEITASRTIRRAIIAVIVVVPVAIMLLLAICGAFSP